MVGNDDARRRAAKAVWTREARARERAPPPGAPVPLNTQVGSFRRLHAEKAAKLAAERAAGISAGGHLGGGKPDGAKDKELKKLKAELAKLRKGDKV
ncbi:hypothetical protein RI054_09g48360 [Pseudoscourfieldia marina]